MLTRGTSEQENKKGHLVTRWLSGHVLGICTPGTSCTEAEGTNRPAFYLSQVPNSKRQDSIPTQQNNRKDHFSYGHEAGVSPVSGNLPGVHTRLVSTIRPWHLHVTYGRQQSGPRQAGEEGNLLRGKLPVPSAAPAGAGPRWAEASCRLVFYGRTDAPGHRTA